MGKSIDEERLTVNIFDLLHIINLSMGLWFN
jgi:hypothetical protein